MSKQETTATALQKTNETAANGGLPLFVEAEKMFDRLGEITRETANRAYDFFVQRGGQWGKELDDWFNAEATVLRRCPVEITETNDKINVTAAVPGFKPDEIEVNVNGNTLFLSGKTEKKEEKKDENVVYSEWASDQFFRQLTLPSEVGTANINAELKDGVLHLALPKAAAKEATRIQVNAG